MGRTDAGSRVIKASPHALSRAFLDPEAVGRWRPPQGMRAEVMTFEPWQGGRFRMAFIYEDPAGAPGKTREDADVFEGEFVELVPDRRIVERVTFQSDDPAFAGVMTVTTTFTPVAGGVEVTMACTEVPAGVSAADHAEGIASSLANLAAFTE